MTKVGICEYCNYEIEGNNYYYIYSFGVETEKQTYFIGLDKAMKDLANFLMDKYVHLSASQIILFRPDIVKRFLETIVGEEKIIEFCLVKYAICDECYKEYITLMPLV